MPKVVEQEQLPEVRESPYPSRNHGPRLLVNSGFTCTLAINPLVLVAYMI